jgi:hypothetical protein
VSKLLHNKEIKEIDKKKKKYLDLFYYNSSTTWKIHINKYYNRYKHSYLFYYNNQIVQIITFIEQTTIIIYLFFHTSNQLHGLTLKHLNTFEVHYWYSNNFFYWCCYNIIPTFKNSTKKLLTIICTFILSYPNCTFHKITNHCHNKWWLTIA